MTEIIQGSPEWLQIRLGKVTASRVADVVAKTKSGYSTSRANYLAQLVAERLTGVPGDSFTNAAMQWGTEKEPEARSVYAEHTGVIVEQIGFVDHPIISMSGASPDGLVGFDGLIEIKCPNTATHIETLLGQKVPAKYETQMLWQMTCTNRDWCDFVSYDPRLPAPMNLFIKRVVRDGQRITELESEVSTFLTELDETVRKLCEIYNVKEAA